MTHPQFSDICNVCGKKVTPNHTHENDTPEEMATAAGTAEGPICETCALPGTHFQHEIDGLHDGPCPVCKKPITPGHVVAHQYDTDAQKKAYARITAVQPVSGSAPSVNNDYLQNIINGFTGGQEIMDTLVSIPAKKARGATSLPAAVERFDGSGARSASEYASTRGMQLSSHPAYGAFTQAKVVLKAAGGGTVAPNTVGGGRSIGGQTGFHVAEVIPHVRVEHRATVNRGHEDAIRGSGIHPTDFQNMKFLGVEQFAHPETSAPMLRLHAEGLGHVEVPEASVSLSSQQVPGIIIGQLNRFVPDTEVHDLSYTPHPQAPKKLGVSAQTTGGRTMTESQAMGPEEQVSWYAKQGKSIQDHFRKQWRAAKVSAQKVAEKSYGIVPGVGVGERYDATRNPEVPNKSSLRGSEEINLENAAEIEANIQAGKAEHEKTQKKSKKKGK